MATPTPNRGPLIFVAIVGGGAVLLLLVLGAFLLLRGPSGLTDEQIQATGAAQTVAAQLTQVVIQQTIAPPQATDTPAPPTNTPQPPVTDTPAPPTVTPTAACTDQVAFVSDVTVPDNTYFASSTTFTKTWRLKNAGTCSWTTSYALVFDSGNIMGGPTSQNLAGNVAPGANVDISVVLTSPSSNGTHRGNWKLRNDRGTIFGLSGGPFYVQIIVGPTPTSGPTVHKATQFTVRQTWQADLDSGSEASGSGVDFHYHAQTAVEKYFEPLNGAVMVKMAGVPDYSDCKNAALSSSMINLNTFPTGSWMCYKTNEGRYGRFTLDSYGDPDGTTMYIDMRTWNNP